MTPETWLPVVGWEGLYEVSDLGQVRSLPRMTRHAGLRGGRILQQALDGRGYPKVVLSGDGRREDQRVHRLVLRAFVGPCPDGMETLHGRRGRTVAALDNLRYGTHVENMHEKLMDGTSNRGERCGRAKLTLAQVQEIRARLNLGERGRHLATEFGVNEATISLIRSRKNWAWAD